MKNTATNTKEQHCGFCRSANYFYTGFGRGYCAQCCEDTPIDDDDDEEIEVEILLPLAGFNGSSFVNRFTTSAQGGKRYRDIALNGEVVGTLEKQDGEWWIDLGGQPIRKLGCDLRSTARATAVVAAYITECMARGAKW